MRCLCLSGGSVKGAFQLGVLKHWMGDLGLDYDAVVGVSVGALNAAGISQVPKGDPRAAIDWIEDFWRVQISGTSSIHKRWFPFGRLHSLWEKSIYDSSPLQKLVRDNLDLDKSRKNGRIIEVGAVCLDDGEHRFGRHDDPLFAEWVLASASYPVFMLPIEIDGKLWSDGGIFNITPLAQAIRLGATEIDIIMCGNPWEKNTWTSGERAAVPHGIIRMLELMSSQIARSDIESLGLQNDLADLNTDVRIRLMVPSSPLDVDSLEFNPNDIEKMINQGYDDAVHKRFIHVK